jgi:hypothetical protein
MHILATLPENQLAPSALRQVFRRALRCGGMGPEKISNAPLKKMLFNLSGQCVKDKREGKFWTFSKDC